MSNSASAHRRYPQLQLPLTDSFDHANMGEGDRCSRLRLWGDFRMFLAGDDPSSDRIAAFAMKVESDAGGNTYGFSKQGCAAAVVAELNRRLSEQA